jgi:hypothetical protein
MKVVRIFLKPDGSKWFDRTLAPNQTMQLFESAWRADGVLVDDTGLVPYRSMLFAYTFDLSLPAAAGNNPNGKPTAVLVHPWGSNPTPPDKPA